MKSALIVAGVVLLLLGIGALAYLGITQATTETVVEAGPVEVQVEEKEMFPVPPVLAIAAILGGAACLVLGARAHP